MDVHEIPRLDVSRSELAKMNFVESGYFSTVCEMVSSPGALRIQRGRSRTRRYPASICGTDAPLTR